MALIEIPISHRPKRLLEAIKSCIYVDIDHGTFWPIECAAAWIAGTDTGIDKLFKYPAAYYKDPPSLIDVYNEIIRERSIDAQSLLKTSRELLRRALTDGSIQADGLDSRSSSKRRSSIPPEEWADLIFEASTKPGQVEARDGSFVYDSVRVRSADLLRVFPVSNHRDDDIDARIKQLTAETNSDLIGQNTLFEKMRAEFPGLTREKIREAHKRVFGERSRGRPSKKRPSA